MPLPTCRIDWRALSAVIDGADPDRDPDAVPLAHLSVKFTAGRTRIVTTSPPETVFLHPIEWSTDAGGYLVSPDGQRGLYLVASDIDPENVWTWTVRISSTPTSPHQITAVSYSFIAPSGGSIDLSTVIPVPAVPARDLPAWQEAVSTTTAARDETLAARDETVTNAASALASASAAAASATTAQTAATTATNAATTAAIGGFLSGTGSPQGVASAPVGSQYRDTAATTGAVIWVKASGTGTSGWVVQYGDTGWRNVSSLIAPGFAVRTLSPTFKIKRIGSKICFEARIEVPAGSALIGVERGGSAATVLSLPSGFAGGSFVSVGAVMTGAIPGVARFGSRLTDLSVVAASGAWVQGDTVNFAAEWTTPTAWPTVLPGTATT